MFFLLMFMSIEKDLCCNLTQILKKMIFQVGYISFNHFLSFILFCNWIYLNDERIEMLFSNQRKEFLRTLLQVSQLICLSVTSDAYKSSRKTYAAWAS